MTGRLHRLAPAWKTALLMAVVGLLLSSGAIVSVAGAPRAQEQFDLAQALQPLGALTVAQPAGASLDVTAASFVLGAGQTTLPLINRTDILVVVQSGTVRVLTNHAPSRTFQGGDSANGFEGVLPGITAQAESGQRITPDAIPDGTLIGGELVDADRWYELPQGYAFNVEAESHLQFRGITQALVLIIAIKPESAWS